MNSVFAMPKTNREVLIAYNKIAPVYDLMNGVCLLGRDKPIE